MVLAQLIRRRSNALENTDRFNFNQEESFTFVYISASVFKRPAPAEQPVLPPPSSILTTIKTDSIQNNRLFKIESLNPFQNR